MTRKTFVELSEGWQFCGFRILRDKWERIAVCLSPDDVLLDSRRELMKRIEVKLRDETRREMSGLYAMTGADAEEIVLQTNEPHYAGPLLYGRFQVMGSWLPGSYYLVDHTLDDLLVRESTPGSHIRRFDTVEESEAYALSVFTKSSGGSIEDFTARGSSDASLGVKDMAKPATQKKPAPAKKAAVTRVPATTRAAPAKKEDAPAKKEVGATVKKETVARGTGVGARTQELIRAGKDNEFIIAALQKEFPDKANSASNVNWYRNKVKKTG